MKKLETLIVSVFVSALSLAAAPTLAEENTQKQEQIHSSQLMTEQACGRICAEKTTEKREKIRKEHHEREIMQNRDEYGIHAR
ncbi:MAG: hypothetical protein ACI86X_000696 [Moritella sp.]|jgi:hypothetical protein